VHTIIVGGGAIGLAIAWRAAVSGTRVTVVDPDPGKGASWAAAGMLAPVAEAHYGEDALLELSIAAAGRWPAFADELSDTAGRDAGYLPCGTVVVARDNDDQAVLADALSFRRRLGLAVEKLTARELRRLEPALSPRVRGGLYVAGDHQVDNRALVLALLAACEHVGVRIERASVGRIDVRGETVQGVTLAEGNHLAADAVVLAAGAWSGQVPGLPPAAVPPVRPVKGELLHLRGDPLVSHVVRGLDVYVVPRADGRVVVGATSQEQGFDKRVTAGGVLDLLRYAYELLPGITELELVEVTAGVRPGSPDNAPLLGATAVEGLLLATGHYRNGIHLTPVTADAIARLLRGQAADDIAAFSPLRFRREVVA
jgi:glycine oxidase